MRRLRSRVRRPGTRRQRRPVRAGPVTPARSTPPAPLSEPASVCADVPAGPAGRAWRRHGRRAREIMPAGQSPSHRQAGDLNFGRDSERTSQSIRRPGGPGPGRRGPHNQDPGPGPAARRGRRRGPALGPDGSRQWVQCRLRVRPK